MANTITFSGLSSGLDTSSWIEALVSVKQTTITSLTTANSVQESLLNVVSNIKSFFTSFQTCLQKLTDASFGINSMDLFMQNLASSTNMNIATATATTEAARQSYEVLVERLASTTKTESGFKTSEVVKAGLNTKLGLLGVQNGTISVNNQSFNITTDDTIKSLIEKFSNVGVVASFNERNSKFSITHSVGEINDGSTNLKSALKLQDNNVSGLISGSIGYVHSGTSLGDLYLTGGKLKIDGREVSFNITNDASGNFSSCTVKEGTNTETIRTVGDFLDMLKDNFGAEEASVDNYGNITIKGCTLESVAGETNTNIKEVLGLVEQTDRQVMTSGTLHYMTPTYATESTTLSTITGDATGTTYGLTINGTEITGITGATTLGTIKTKIEEKGGTFTINADNTVTIEGVELNTGEGTVTKALGLEVTAQSTTITSNNHSYTSSNSLTSNSATISTTEHDIDGSTKISSFAGGTDATSYTLSINGSNVTGITGATTLDTLKTNIEAKGGTFTINDDNTITIEGVELAGTTLTALGLEATAESTTITSNNHTYTSSNAITSGSATTSTTNNNISGSTTLKDITGSDSSYTLSINGGTATTLASTTTLDTIKSSIEAAGGKFTINADNTVTIEGVELNTGTGTVANALGLEATAESTTITSNNHTYTSANAITSGSATTSTTSHDINGTTTLSNITGAATDTAYSLTINGSNVAGITGATTLDTIKTKVEAAGGTFTINDDNTVTVEGVELNTGAGTVANALGLTATASSQTTTSGGHTYTSSNAITSGSATTSTTNNNISGSTTLKDITGSDSSYTLSINGGAATTLASTTTLDTIKSSIETAGGKFTINADNTITIEGVELAGTTLTALGLEATAESTTITSNNHSYTSANAITSGSATTSTTSHDINGTTTLSNITGAATGTAYSLTINGSNVAGITGATTLDTIKTKVEAAGGTFTINDDNTVTVEGVELNTGAGTVANALGLTATGTSQTTTSGAHTYVSSNAITSTTPSTSNTQQDISGSTTLSNITGAATDTEYTLSINGNTLSGITGATDLNTIKTNIENNGGMFTINDNNTISVEGVELSGTVLDALGMTATGSSQTTTSSGHIYVSSNAIVGATPTVSTTQHNITGTTTLSDITGAAVSTQYLLAINGASGTYHTGATTLDTIKTKVEAAGGTFTINDDNTITIEGVVVETFSGTVGEALGLTATGSSQTTTTNGHTYVSSNTVDGTATLVSTVNHDITGSTTLSDITGDATGTTYTLTLNGATISGITGATTIDALKTQIESKGGTLTINDNNTVSIKGVTVIGSVATALGLTATASSSSVTSDRIHYISSNSVTSSQTLYVKTNTTSVTSNKTYLYDIPEGDTSISLNELKTRATTGDKLIAEFTQLTKAEAEAQGYTWVTDDAGLQTAIDNNEKICLGADINLSTIVWNPKSNFSGELNGNGHTISNLNYISLSNYGGLIKTTTSDAKICNLILDNFTISTNYNGAGALVGANYGTIDNVTVINSTISAKQYAGGVAGVSYGDMSNVANINTSVTTTDIISGGIVGALGGTAADQGGATMTNAYSAGSVSAKATVGGIVGQLVDTNLINAYNDGDLSATQTDSRIGGIAGQTADDNVTITNVYNTYDVGSTLKNYMGGIVGTTDATLTTMDKIYISNYTETPSTDTTHYGSVVGGIYSGNTTVTNLLDTTGVKDYTSNGGGGTYTVSNAVYDMTTALDTPSAANISLLDISSTVAQMGFKDGANMTLIVDGVANTLSFDSTDSLEDIKNVLATYGISTSVSDGKVTFSSTNHTFTMSGALGNYLTSDNTPTTTTTRTTATGNTLLSQLGVKSGTVDVKDSNGNTIGSVNIDSSMSINQVMSAFSDYGISMSVSSGQITYTATGNVKLVDGSSNMISQLYLDDKAMSLSELKTAATTGDQLIANFAQLTQAEAEAQGYTWVTTKDQLQTAINNNEKICLGADISVGSTWTSKYNFSGEINGNGYTLNNLKKSLVESTTSTAVIQNLKLKNVNITANYGYTGAVVGQNNGTIDNVTVLSGTVKTTYLDVGGIVGQNANGGRIYNVANFATVTGAEDAGGIVGSSLSGSKILNAYNGGGVTATSNAGGIVGHSEGVEITNAYNNSNINGVYVGGIVGVASTYYNTNINNAANYGTITTTSSGYMAGGILGTTTSDSTGQINNAYNFGTTPYGILGSGAVVGQYNFTNIKNYTGGSLSMVSGLEGAVPTFTQYSALNSPIGASLNTLNTSTTLAQMGFSNGGTIELTVDGVTHNLSFAGTDSLNNVINILSNYDIKTTVSSGTVKFESIGHTFDMNGDLGDYLTSSKDPTTTVGGAYESANLEYTTSSTATANSTLESLGINSGTIYIKDGSGNVKETLNIDNTNTLQQVMSQLSPHGISLSINNGKLSYTTTGNIKLVNGSSNMVSQLTLDDKAMSLSELKTAATTGDQLIANFTQLTQAEAEAQGYTWVITKDDLQTALNNNAKICLGADIDLTGSWSATELFSGELNGNGYTLSNLSVGPNASSRAGLIGSTEENAIIRNLKLSNIQAESSVSTAGALVGWNCGIIDNVTVLSGKIQADVAGGIVGSNEGSISNVANFANIENIYSCSGNGGIVGMNGDGSILNAYNGGNISGADGATLGGIIGSVYSTTTIENVYNDGDLVPPVELSSCSVGGIVGWAFSTTNITNAYNNGNDSDNPNSGGIIGIIDSPNVTISKAYNNGSMYAGIVGMGNSNSLTTTDVANYRGGTLANNVLGAITQASYSQQEALNMLAGADNTALSTSTTLAQMGFQDGSSLQLTVDGTTHTIEFASTDTLQKVIDTLQTYGVTTTVNGSGTLTFNSIGKTFSLAGELGNYLAAGANTTTTTGGAYKSGDLGYTTTENATASSTLESMGINSGTIYIKDGNGNVKDAINIDSSNTMQQVISQLSPYGINMSIDNTGKVSYTTTGNLKLVNGSSNLVSQLYLDDHAMSLNDIKTNATTGDRLIADFTQLTQAEAEAQGYTWVTTKADLQTALNNNEKVCLGADIDLTGGWATVSNFSGELNGNGYTLSNLSLSASTNDCALIETTTSDAVIKNLKMANLNISTACIGAGLVINNNGTIDNVTILSGRVGASDTAGGIVATNTGSISNVANFASVINGGGTNSGGIVGTTIDGSTIYNVYNGGTISGPINSSIGGIVGQSTGTLTLENAYNDGIVDGPNEDTALIGGIIGYAEYGVKNITNVYNNGRISGGTNKGGIIGYMIATNGTTISQAYNNGSSEGAGIIGNTNGYTAYITDVANYKGGSLINGGIGSGSITEASYSQQEALNMLAGADNTTLSTSTTLAQMGFDNGGTVRLNIDGAQYTLDFGANSTLEHVIDSLATHGVITTVDTTTGVLTFNSIGKSFSIGGDLGNYLIMGGTTTTTPGGEYKSIDLGKTNSDTATANSTLESMGISSGTIYIRDGNGNIKETLNIDNSNTLQQVISQLSPYGINMSITDGKVGYTTTGNYTLADGSSNLVSRTGIDGTTTATTEKLTTTTTLAQMGFSDGGALKLTMGGTQYTLEFGAGDTLQNVIDTLGYYGVTTTVDATTGALTFKSIGDTFNIGGNLGNYLTAGGSTTTSANGKFVSSDLGYETTANATANSTLESMRINSGTIYIKDGNGNITETLNIDNTNTLQQVMNQLSPYGINMSITDGKVGYSTTGNYTLADGSSNLVSQTGINGTPTATTETLAVGTTLAQMGFADGATLRLTVDNTQYSLEFGANDTLQSVINSLSYHDITTSVDANGKVTFKSIGHKFNISGDLGNYLTSSNAATNTASGAYESSNLGYETTANATANSTLESMGINSGTIYIKDGSGNVVETLDIDNTNTLQQVMNQLSPYGITMTINSGKVGYSTTGNYTLADGSSNLVSQTGINGTPTATTAKLSATTTLEQMGFSNGAALNLTIDGTTHNLSFASTDTLQNVIDSLKYQGITTTVDASTGALTFKSIGETFNISGELGNYLTAGGTTNITTGGAYESADLEYTTTANATANSTLESMGINSGTIYIKDGSGNVVETLDIDNTKTLQQVMNQLSPYGITMTVADGKVGYSTTGNYTLADGSSNLVSQTGINGTPTATTAKLSATTTLEQMGFSNGAALNLTIDGVTHNLSFNSTDTLQNVIDSLGYHDITTTVDANGKVKFKSIGHTFNISGNLGTYLTSGNAPTKVDSGAYESEDLGYTTTANATASSTLESMGINSGTIYIKDGSGNVVETLDIDNTNTLQQVMNQLSPYGITMTVADGKVGYSTTGNYTLADGSSNLVSQTGINGTPTATTAKLSATTTLEQMGFANGASLDLTIDGVTHNLSFNSTDTLQNVIDSLGYHDITTSVDANGKVTFHSIGHTFNIAGALGSYLTSGNAATKVDSGAYESGDLGYTTTANATANSTLESMGINSGTIYIKDGSGNVVETLDIDNTKTLQQVMNQLSPYGITMTVADGKVGYSTTGNYTLADGSSNLVSQTGINGTPTATTAKLSATTTLEQMGFKDGADLNLTIDGVTHNLSFASTDTLQNVIDSLGYHDITTSVDANGKVTFKSIGHTFNIAGALGSYLTSGNAATKVDSGAYLSDQLIYDVDTPMTESSKLSELGVASGDFNVMKDGEIIATINVTDDMTVGQLKSGLSVYGVDVTVDSSKLKVSSTNGTTIADGTSNVVSALGLTPIAQGDYKTTGLTAWDSSISGTEVGLLTEDTLLTSLDKNGKTAVGSVIFTLGTDTTKHIINISADDTVGSLIEKFEAEGVNAELVNGCLRIDNGIDGMTLTTEGTSGLVDVLGLTTKADTDVYARSSDTLTYTDNNVIKSVANYADANTTLGTVNITSGKLSIYVDNVKKEITISDTDTFNALFGKITSALGTGSQAGFLDAEGNITTDASKSTGKIGIKVADGKTIIVGASNDTTNLATIADFELTSAEQASGDRVLYKVNTSTKITQAGLFRAGQVSEGTFKIGDAEFTITDDTTIADVVSMINKSDKSYASAYWDSLSGTLVLEAASTHSGSNLMNIEQGTSNFTTILGLTNDDGSLVTERQTLGQNALVRINGTLISSSTNTITSDVSRIEGLTINLKGVSAGETVTIKVEQNTEAIYEAVSDVVDSYNNMMKELEKDLSADGSFANDTLLKMMKNNLKRLMTSTIANPGIFKNVSAIGISTGEAKTDISTNVTALEIDKDAFMKALDSDPDSVKALLVGTDGQKGILAQAYNIVTKALSTTGYLTNLEDSIESKISKNTKKITKLTDALQNYRIMLTNKFKNMESIISKLQNSYSSFTAA